MKIGIADVNLFTATNAVCYLHQLTAILPNPSLNFF